MAVPLVIHRKAVFQIRGRIVLSLPVLPLHFLYSPLLRPTLRPALQWNLAKTPCDAEGDEEKQEKCEAEHADGLLCHGATSAICRSISA